jgi:hypothetical protein
MKINYLLNNIMKNIAIIKIVILVFFSCNSGSKIKLNENNNDQIRELVDSIIIASNDTFDYKNYRCRIIELNKKYEKNNEFIVNYSAFHFNLQNKNCWFSLYEEIENVVPDSNIRLLKIYIWDIDRSNFNKSTAESRFKYLLAYYEFKTKTGETKFIVDPNKTGKYYEPK